MVGRAVASAIARGETTLTAGLLSAAGAEITGAPLLVSDDLLAATADPVTAVMARDVPGGASPARVREHARRIHRRVATAGRRHQARDQHNSRAEAALLQAARRLEQSGS